MKLREFKEEDAESVANLSNSNAQAFQYRDVTPEFLKRMWTSPGYRLFVMEDRGRIIGFCGVYVKMHVAEIGPVCVAETYRKKGFGTFLIESMLAFLQPIKPEKLIIKVKTSNKEAQKFFRYLGFKRVQGVLCGGEPAILMEWTGKI